MTLGASFDAAIDAACHGESWAWCALFGEFVEDLTRYVKASGAVHPEPMVAQAFASTVSLIHLFDGTEGDFKMWLRQVARGAVRAMWEDGGAPAFESRGNDAVAASYLGGTREQVMSPEDLSRIELLVQQLAIVPFHPAFPANPLAQAAGRETSVHEGVLVTAKHDPFNLL